MAGSGEEKNGGVAAVSGGVEDAYGEDRATEDQPVTPWAVCVASGHSLLRDPRHNKGLSFTEKERDAHYLRGLLPPVVLSQELQEKRLLQNVRQFEVPLQRYMALMDLQERNERLFYKLLVDNVEELLPVVYTPTVGEACQKYGSIFRRPQGLYISLKEKGRILEVLRNWPEKSIQVIVVTDGERILGLGDLGCQGMGIPVGKLALYIVLLEVSGHLQTMDRKVLVQFEDFANHNAFALLEKYRENHLVFNDDIQAGTGIAELVALAISRQSKFSIDEARNKIWLVDSKAIRPTALIGSAGVARSFTKEVVEAMSSINKRPIILALSNPTSQSECTAEQAYSWSQGHAIFGSGSPFDPVKYNNKVFVPAQANNAYIFPGFGLGVVICRSDPSDRR
ncbi:hypothetical protein PR202_gb04801 [Eleusine coracana subsp. coracana]|uniref:Malic enzyme n=1 Tax=Eleusine coracana subsp. coracana TaxID=191504 RepID=A0AAV5E3T1_ELECO|nr:hypothetical protein PR202_gb04801 [Eleusine coracana subsp. coracana]